MVFNFYIQPEYIYTTVEYETTGIPKPTYITKNWYRGFTTLTKGFKEFNLFARMFRSVISYLPYDYL